MAADIQVNGLVLPINDAHIHQRRGVTAARTEAGEPLHFTVSVFFKIVVTLCLNIKLHLLRLLLVPYLG